MSEETVEKGIKRNEDGTFADGTAPGPGRQPEDEKAKLTKRAIKELVKEYKEDLAQILPDLKPILIELAKKGDMTAIKEIHDRVMDKSKQPTDITSDGEKITPIYGGFSKKEHDKETASSGEQPS
jgi:hypothetical protein